MITNLWPNTGEEALKKAALLAFQVASAFRRADGFSLVAGPRFKQALLCVSVLKVRRVSSTQREFAARKAAAESKDSMLGPALTPPLALVCF